jgi:predicted SAM-dependent methyltransferase
MQRKANIGTRHWTGPDVLHIDIDASPLVDEDGGLHPVDLVCDATKIPLPDGCMDHVHSSEALEHIAWPLMTATVAEWARLVSPGGTMRIETPDGCAAAAQLLSEESLELHRAMSQIVYGEQTTVWDTHRALVTHLTLVADVEASGMEVTNVERGHECGWLRVDSRKPT